MPALPAVPALELRDVTVGYARSPVLDAVTAEIGQGRICGLLGANGAGKSTLFKTATGMLAPWSGEVLLYGLPPARARGRGLVGYVPQAEQVDWDFPVRVFDVVMMGRYGHMGFTRRPRRADRAAVAEALERTGLTALAHRQIGALSGGQRKRAFVARGIAQEAELLLLDEPFAGVDRGSEATLRALLREMRDAGRTVILATHDLAAVPEVCDEALLLHHRVVAHGPPKEVLTPERLMRAFGMDAPFRSEAA